MKIVRNIPKSLCTLNYSGLSPAIMKLFYTYLFFSGRKEVLSRRLKNFHKEKALNKTIESDFDYVCVIDYEATCSDTQINYPHEIIEFPVVLVNMKTLTIVISISS